MWQWDPIKAEANLRKHKLSFETATLAFSDPLAQSEVDPYETEVRWRTYGMIANQLIVVVHTEPIFDGGGRLLRSGRIISARKATRSERRSYEDAANGK